eukprot:Skav214011  [mRNA]  locus=scaffold1070:367325:369692:- [translate_table: standard]
MVLAQARIRAEKEKAKEKKEQETLQKEERGRSSEEASQKAQEAMEAAKKRLIHKKKLEQLEAEYDQEKESHELGEVLQKKARDKTRDLCILDRKARNDTSCAW